MKAKSYTEEFKVEAVRQVLERGYSRIEVAHRLGISVQSLYRWIEQHPELADKVEVARNSDKDVEIARLKKELARIKEERDILKKAAAYFASNPE